MEKYARSGQATDDGIVGCMRFECWITRATGVHSEYVIFIAFLRQRALKRKRLMLRLYVMLCTLLVVLTLDCWLLASQSDQCSWCVRGRTYVSPSVWRSKLWTGPVMCRYTLSAVGRLQATTKELGCTSLCFQETMECISFT